MSPRSLKVKAKVLTLTLRPLTQLFLPHLQTLVWPHLYHCLIHSLWFNHPHFVLLPLTHQTQFHLRAFAPAALSVENAPTLGAWIPSLCSGFPLSTDTSHKGSLAMLLNMQSPLQPFQTPSQCGLAGVGWGCLSKQSRDYLMLCHHVAAQSGTCDLGCQGREKRAWRWHTGLTCLDI